MVDRRPLVQKGSFQGLLADSDTLIGARPQDIAVSAYSGYLNSTSTLEEVLNFLDVSLKYRVLFEEHFLYDTAVNPLGVLSGLKVLDTNGTFSFEVELSKYGILEADTTNTAGHTVALNKTLVYNYMGSFQGLRVSTSLKHSSFNTDMREIYFGWERYYPIGTYYDRVAIVGETVSTDYKYYLVVENENGQTKTELFSFSSSPVWGDLSIEFTDTAANFSAHGQTASVLKSSANFPTDAAGFPVRNLELRFVSPTGVSASNPVLVDYIKAEVER